MHRVNLAPFEQSLLQALAENVPHRIYAKDAQGRFTFANQAVASGMGVADPAELLGKTDFDFYPAEQAGEYWRLEQELMRTGRPIVEQEEHVQYLLLRQEAWLHTTKIPVRDASGAPVGLVGINYDVTAQKSAELALRAAHAQAAAAAHQLAATVARLDLEVRERQRFEKELRRQALHDALTGLPNRALLLDRLETAIAAAARDAQPLTLLLIDLDRFKLVNDGLGHAVGDELLRTIGRRIGGCVRGGDTLARLGGDEFVLLLPAAMQPGALAALTTRIARRIAEPIRLAGREVSVTCSVGYSVFPQDGADADTLLMRADAAMFRAKENGGNQVRCYAPEIGARVSERLELEAQLKQALLREEFELHYQPQVALAGGRIVGVEALVRWRHPVRGLVPPLHFIPLAEETGLIEPLGEWVLRTACRQAAAWERAGLPPLRMSVNLSARQFLSPGLEATVVSALADAGLAPERLELELTESLSMKQPEETIRIVTALEARGIAIAIDDFGTGYSNLAYLHRFPVHRIKLDRSFVSELGVQASSQAIVEAIVAMAHKLDLEVVAEGVETAQQQEQLRRYGCDMMQGYWFSRPLDAAACEQLVRRHAQEHAPA